MFGGEGFDLKDEVLVVIEEVFDMVECGVVWFFFVNSYYFLLFWRGWFGYVSSFIVVIWGKEWYWI